MSENPWQEIVGPPISAEDAWRVFEDWRAGETDIGMLYAVRGGGTVIAAMCTVIGLRNGLLQVKGEGVGASLNLKLAKFTYGPMQVYPQWPSPPPVEVLGLQAFLATGDWLVMTEGYLARELAPLALPS